MVLDLALRRVHFLTLSEEEGSAPGNTSIFAREKAENEGNISRNIAPWTYSPCVRLYIAVLRCAMTGISNSSICSERSSRSQCHFSSLAISLYRKHGISMCSMRNSPPVSLRSCQKNWLVSFTLNFVSFYIIIVVIIYIFCSYNVKLRFNVPPNTSKVISGTGFYIPIKWPNQWCQSTEGRWLLKIRLQSHQVHPTVLTMIQHILCSMKQKHTK